MCDKNGARKRWLRTRNNEDKNIYREKMLLNGLKQQRMNG